MSEVQKTILTQTGVQVQKDLDLLEGLIYNAVSGTSIPSTVYNSFIVENNNNNFKAKIDFGSNWAKFAGRDVSGISFTIDNTSVSARDGAEVYNYIPGSQTNNIATGASSHVEGVSNIEGGQGDTNHIEGKGNTISASGNEAAHIEGKNNSLTGGGNKVIHIEGYNNTLSGAGNNYISIRGSGNTFSASGTSDIIVDGTSNSITNGGGSSIFVRGQSNTIATNNFHQSDISGYGNKILDNVSGNLVYILGYSNEVGAQSGTTSVNGLNISGRSNKFTTGSTVGLSISGDGNTVSGNLMGCTVFGYQNTFKTKGSSPGLLLGGYNNTTDANSLIHYGSVILGENNSVTSTGGINCGFIFGNGINVSGDISNGSTIFGASHTFSQGSSTDYSLISGGFNTVSNAQYSLVSGFNLNVNSLYGIFCGKYNYLDNHNDLLCIGNGNSSSRTNALVLDNSGNMVVSGNIQSSTGVTLSTVRNTLTSINADDASYTFATLPANGSETILSSTYTVEEITITNIATMPKADADNYLSGNSSTTQARTSDYTSVIIFKKSSNLTNISDAITNFSETDNTKIYLLNPDLDISNYTIIHIMLFFDGFNMCAIAAGYEEVAPL